MELESKTFNTDELVAAAQRALWFRLGSVGIRLVESEIDRFFKYDLPELFRDAYRKAESEGIRLAVAQAEQSSRTLLEGVLAGVELAEKKKKP